LQHSRLSIGPFGSGRGFNKEKTLTAAADAL
jgi:hypothetical protein